MGKSLADYKTPSDTSQRKQWKSDTDVEVVPATSRPLPSPLLLLLFFFRLLLFVLLPIVRAAAIVVVVVVFVVGVRIDGPELLVRAAVLLVLALVRAIPSSPRSPPPPCCSPPPRTTSTAGPRGRLRLRGKVYDEVCERRTMPSFLILRPPPPPPSPSPPSPPSPHLLPPPFVGLLDEDVHQSAPNLLSSIRTRSLSSYAPSGG